MKTNFMGYGQTIFPSLVRSLGDRCKSIHLQNLFQHSHFQNPSNILLRPNFLAVSMYGMMSQSVHPESKCQHR